MKQLTASIHIAATPEQVWQILTDFNRYPEWNPFIIFMKGEAAPGQTLRETVRQPDGKQLQFTSRIVIWNVGKHLAWDGYLGAPFLFKGRHEFILEEIASGTQLTQRETFTGLLLPFLNIDTILPGYHQMNEALKTKAETPQ